MADRPQTAPDRKRAVISPLIPATIMVVVSLCWSLQYPFWPNRESLLDQGKIVDYSWIAFILYIGGIGLWLWSLWALVPYVKGATFNAVRPMVIPVTAMVYTAFTLMYPTNAIDVYIYAVRSRLLTEYGANPNAVLPEAWWDIDPYMRFASQEWADDTSPYGPLWNQIAAPVTALAGDNIGLAVIGFKLISVLAIVAIGWLVHDTVKARYPDWAVAAMLFWLWNPLVLWDGIGNAHNDVTLMVPAVAAIWAWSKRYDHLVLPLLFASFLIKYVTIILVPIALVALWRRNSPARRLEGGLWAAGGGILLLAIGLYPFYDFNAIIDSARAQGARISSSPAWWVLATTNRLGIGNLDAERVRDIAYTITIAGIGVWSVLTWLQPSRLVRASFEVTFLFMLVASINQRGWYVIWLVPLAAVLIPSIGWQRTLTWSVTSMAGHACSIWLWYVWDWDKWDRYWYSSIMVGVVFVPVLVVTVWELYRLWRARADRPTMRRIG